MAVRSLVHRMGLRFRLQLLLASPSMPFRPGAIGGAELAGGGGHHQPPVKRQLFLPVVLFQDGMLPTADSMAPEPEPGQNGMTSSGSSADPVSASPLELDPMAFRTS